MGECKLSPISKTTTDQKTAQQILDETFLVLRSKLIDIAANLDRIERCDQGEVADDPRMQKIAAAVRILNSPAEPAERAKQLQMLFSRTYESKWRSDFKL